MFGQDKFTGGSEGINRLARILQGRMQCVGDKPPLLDFGEIQSDMSLLTNCFKRPIPQTDYMICRSVCYDPNTLLTENIVLPRKMYRIQQGDRVLVAWLGDDAVVIDIIMRATEMM